MKKIVGIAILLVMTLVAAGCFFDKEESLGELPYLPYAAMPDTEQNKSVGVDVYWDATCSMQGYTTIQQQNTYQRLPDNLEDIGISMGEIHFFRFGEEIQPLEGREHRQFMTPEYYTELITPIHKVVEQADGKHLSVVVSDLFESDADWSNVAKQIKSKYFENHQSVAVIGVKNPFKGDIFDVGYSAGGKFFYDSGTDAAKYRPFYMLVMGPTDDVRSFVAKCKERIGTGANVKYLLFSEELVEKVPDLNTIDYSNSENIFMDSKLQVPDKRMVEFGVNDKSATVKLETAINYKPFADVCQIDTNSLQPVIKVSKLENGEWVEETDVSAIRTSLEEKTDSDNTFVYNMEFQPNEVLNADSVTLLQTFIVPGRDGLHLPAWVQEWNMDNQASFDAGQFDGSKTINLVSLMSSLKDSSTTIKYPSIANIFMVIKN
ncbi:MAG: hypothetical protein PHQ44_00555 [Anaerovibrio sp.]|nr:hypothetical protein [Anaerovibrio sp.]